jgi:hypothetical protein
MNKFFNFLIRCFDATWRKTTLTRDCQCKMATYYVRIDMIGFLILFLVITLAAVCVAYLPIWLGVLIVVLYVFGIGATFGVFRHLVTGDGTLSGDDELDFCLIMLWPLTLFVTIAYRCGLLIAKLF